MRINKVYGVSKTQEIAHKARYTNNEEAMLRFTKSDSNLVLQNLAMNDNLTDESVQALFDRNINSLTKRLQNLGYKNKSWF